MWFGVFGPSWSRGSMTDESCKRVEAGFEAKVNRTKEGEMGRGEIGSAGRSVGQLDSTGLDWIGFTGGGRWAGGQSGCRTAGILRWVALVLVQQAPCRQARPVSANAGVQQECHASDAGSPWWVQPQSGRMSSCVPRWCLF